ncbi:spermidine/putrescine ABC transporter ATP-binding protein PotA [Candidatus Uabimicrobium amorphum]|uniref:Spermidine/putrescine import ATP-binding protein PotA n=1 Tax=Uabimicrobium amorphum TaxID=2596890 RepID=A0A5S9IMX9_UABAM|nr:spermidine/putrescine ABC transporter ATP-binding protein PotA [Candidatus Uabimicrobium amorphum]BBM84292.1 spermidine/putrescine import ATP-binding protein PotA [Candidatus Uabimicrobium amorphum]
MTQKIIELKNVSKSFGNDKVLHNINLDISNGEFLTLLGPSGCGKTTILRLIAGFENPSDGEIFLNGEKINAIPANKRNVCTVFQNYALFPHMNVFDNVAFGLRIKNLNAEEIKTKVDAVLKMVKLENFAQRKPHQLSGGQQQRVAIARAVVNDPLVLVLDEPLSALDYKLRKDMQIELKELQRRLGITFIFVTHDQEEALSMSDRIVILNNGNIEQIGSPQQIYEMPQSLFVAQFIGEANVLTGHIEEVQDDFIKVQIAQSCYQFHYTHSKLQKNDKVNVILRPEDLQIYLDNAEKTHCLSGKITNIVYKGATVDLRVALENDNVVTISEFFDDSRHQKFVVNQTIQIGWADGVEVILHDT